MVQGRFLIVRMWINIVVATIDQQLAAALFREQNPIRQALYASGNRFTVIE